MKTWETLAFHYNVVGNGEIRPLKSKPEGERSIMDQ